MTPTLTTSWMMWLRQPLQPMSTRKFIMARMLEAVSLTTPFTWRGMYHKDAHIGHSISNKKFCCFSYIIAMVYQNSPTVEFWQEKIEGNMRRANMEPSVDFRRANTEPSADFR